MSTTFLGTIRDGRLFLDKADQYKAHLQSFPNEKRVEVTVEKLTRTRSNNQNAYYWAVIIKEIAQHTGHDPEQIHELLKAMFSPRWHFPGPTKKDSVWFGVGIPTSTTRLDTLAFVEYTEKCRLWANEFLGLQIPLPGEIDI